jgi:hypothetical protein
MTVKEPFFGKPFWSCMNFMTANADFHRKQLYRMMTKSKALLLLLLLTRDSPGLAQECTADGKCDTHERCPVWRDQGECVQEKAYMNKYCPASCAHPMTLSDDNNSQVPLECKDYLERCPVFANLGECKVNPEMRKWCPHSCGRCDADGQLHPDMTTFAPDDEDDEIFEENWEEEEVVVSSIDYSSSFDDETTAMIRQSESFGLLQTAEGATSDKTIQRIRESIDYMKSDQVLDLSPRILENCKVRKSRMYFWSVCSCFSLGRCSCASGIRLLAWIVVQ